MHSILVIFRVCQKEKRLIPSCRGLQGGSSGRFGVENGCLWWPETGSEVAQLALLSRSVASVFSSEKVTGMKEMRGG